MRSYVVCMMAVIVLVVSLGVTFASATQNPVPFVNQPLIPSSVAPGGAGFTLTVNGTGFVSGSTVNWNGSPRTTTFINGSQLTASILSSDIATATTASVAVSSPAPGGGGSSVVFLPVRNAASFVSLNSSSLGTSFSPLDLAVADFDKDGRQDVAVVTEGSTQEIVILLGRGDGTFSQGSEYSISGASLSSIFAADVNLDGNVDLIVPDANRGLIILLGNGNGTFQHFVEYPSTEQLFSAAIGDFNRDGFVDVATAYTDGFCIFLGNGDGTFATANCINISTGYDFEDIIAGDFNRDGNLDLAMPSTCCGNAVVAIELGNGDGTFQSTQTYPLGGISNSLITADFNGDGKLDLAAPLNNSSAVSIILGNGDGSFQSPLSFAAALFPSTLLTADMNGDGKLDLVIGSYGFDETSVSILLGNGDGTFQDHVDYDGMLALSPVVGDFDDDGRLDVSVANGASNTLSMLMQDSGTVVQLSPAELKFPMQLLDTVSDPKLITLTNTGSSAIKIKSVSVTPNFSQLNNCKTIQPGRSCKIGVYFTPTMTGKLTGYLAIADNGGGSPQTVALSGTATIVSIAPNKLDFGAWPVHHISTSQNVVVANEGNGSLSIGLIGLAGPNAKDFSEVNACPAKLQAGSSCTITVIFHPLATGPRNAILGIEDNGGGSPQKVPLTGTGT